MKTFAFQWESVQWLGNASASKRLWIWPRSPNFFRRIFLRSFWFFSIWYQLHIFGSRVLESFDFFDPIHIAHFGGFFIWSRLHDFWRSFSSGVVNIFEYDSDWGRLLNWQSHQLLTASSGAVQLLNHNKVILKYISLLQSGNLNFQTFRGWLGNQIRAWNILTLKL